MTDRWPKWHEPATKGDIVRLAVYQRSVNVNLASMMLAIMKGDQVEAQKAYQKYAEANDELEVVLNDIGGE